jgi:hypothetical protein
VEQSGARRAAPGGQAFAAALTAAQAALITEGILEAMEALAEAGLAHGNLHANNVHVGRRGQVRIGDGGVLPLLRAGEAGTWAARDAAAVAKLLGRVAGQNGVRQTAPDWRSSAAGALVEAAGAARQSCGPENVAALRRAAGQLLEEGTRERTAGEVAALVRAVAPVSRTERPAPAPEPLPLPPPDPVPAGTAALRFALSWLLERRRPLGAVVALAVCLPALWLAAGWLGGLGHRPAAVARGTPAVLRPTTAPAQAAPAPAAPAPPGPRPVPELAPLQSGPISAVEISPLGDGCSAGADCALRVAIRLQPSSSSQPLAWTLKVFDRCSGATTELPGVQMTAGAGWNLASGTSYPSLPPGRSLAVMAVTTAPVQAASPPLLLPAGGSTC